MKNTYEMFVRYADDEAAEIIQRLQFKADSIQHAFTRANYLRKLVKSCGDKSKLVLLGVAKVDTLKKYSAMPAGKAYLGQHKDAFIKKAVKKAQTTPAKPSKLKMQKSYKVR